MNPSSEAAEQVVRISLEGVEVAARLTGSGAKNIAALLFAIAKDQQKIRGKTRLTNMLKSGHPLKVFSLKENELKTFSDEAKKYGVLFSAIIEKNNSDKLVDIMVREEDASKVNRIFERFKLSTVDLATVKGEVEKIKTAKEKVLEVKDKEQLIKDEKLKEQKESINPNLEEAKTKNQSKTSLDNSKTSENFISNKQSVKEELKKIKEELTEKEKSKPKNKVTEHKQSNKKKEYKEK